MPIELPTVDQRKIPWFVVLDHGKGCVSHYCAPEEWRGKTAEWVYICGAFPAELLPSLTHCLKGARGGGHLVWVGEESEAAALAPATRISADAEAEERCEEILKRYIGRKDSPENRESLKRELRDVLGKVAHPTRRKPQVHLLWDTFRKRDKIRWWAFVKTLPVVGKWWAARQIRRKKKAPPWTEPQPREVLVADVWVEHRIATRGASAIKVTLDLEKIDEQSKK